MSNNARGVGSTIDYEYSLCMECECGMQKLLSPSPFSNIKTSHNILTIIIWPFLEFGFCLILSCHALLFFRSIKPFLCMSLPLYVSYLGANTTVRCYNALSKILRTLKHFFKVR